MDERLERVWARWCARRVLHLWDAPEVVRGWLDTGEEALRVAARQAAWGECEVWDSLAQRAAWAAAAEENWDFQWENEAAWSAKRVAEEESEHSAQQHARALIDTLATLLPEHGLSALRLDEALEDRWLTREVWRALELPDLRVVCDWAGSGLPTMG